MHSFIITLTYKGFPVIFCFTSTVLLAKHMYEVSALNEKSFPKFLIQHGNGQWKITSEVPDDMMDLEEKLGVMLDHIWKGDNYIMAQYPIAQY